MNKERIETGKAPHINIECLGDLIVKGWDDSGVRARGDCEIEETEKGLKVYSSDNLRLDVPHLASLVVTAHSNTVIKGVDGEVIIGEAMGDLIAKDLKSLTLQQAHGNVVCKNIDDAVSLDEAMGDTALRNVGDARLGRVHGNLGARNVNGRLEVDEVMGDFSARSVSGDVKVDRSKGNANLRNLGGLLQLDEVMGDINLRGDLPAGDHYCKAHGNIVVRWPVDAPLNVTATAPQIVNRLPLEAVEQANGEYRGRLGNGDVNLTLVAKGDIILKSGSAAEHAGAKGEDYDFNADFDFDYDFDFDFDTLGDRLSSQINDRMSELTSHIESRFGPEFAQKMAEKATRKAERAVERAMRHVERHRRHAERGAYRSAWSSPPPKPSKKTTAEEQLQILQMLEKGVISTQEANLLLEALES